MYGPVQVRRSETFWGQSRVADGERAGDEIGGERLQAHALMLAGMSFELARPSTPAGEFAEIARVEARAWAKVANSTKRGVREGAGPRRAAGGRKGIGGRRRAAGRAGRYVQAAPWVPMSAT